MKGLKSTAEMLISDGSFTINSADDSVHSNASITVNGGIFEIASGDDAVHADETLTITAGTIHITESYEGVEAVHIKVQGGDISLVASDDGLNAAGGTDSSGTTGGRDGMFGGGPGGGGGMSPSSNGSITISGGTLHINASGDGIDANGSLTISGGYTVVVGPTQGDTATLDYDTTAMITGGTFIGTGRRAGIFSDEDEQAMETNPGFKSKMDKALFADATATSIGAIFGTSNTTTYVESAAGIGAGGRTGLTSVIVALCFAISAFLATFVSAIPFAATAPALVVVGIMMMSAFKEIQWDDFDEAVPAFFAGIFMALCYSISYGIAAGFIFYCITKICKKKVKEIHPILWIATALFILNFVLLAII